MTTLSVPARPLDAPCRLRALAPFVAAVLLLGGLAAGASAQSAQYNITPLGPTTSDVVNFLYNDTCPGPLSQLKWTFGDGSSQTNNDPAGTGCNTTHTYASQGVYHTKLTVMPSGQSLFKDVGILSLAASTAQLTADFTWTAGNPYVFQDATQPANSVGWWEWMVDGSPFYVQNPSKALTPGDHSVTLSVQNQNSFSTVTKTVHVPNTQPPVAYFAYLPVSPQPGEVVSFADNSLYGPTSWSWDFGDGDSSPLQNPTHAFATAGTFNVTLTATNVAGSSTKTRAVIVGATSLKPTAAFSFSPPHPTPDAALVRFSDESTNSPQDWSWDFGDPASGVYNSSNVQNPVHQFSGAGNYTVTLIAINGFGSSDPFTATVTVSNCEADGHTLCLNNGRFQVSVTWSVPSPANSGAGNAVGLTDDTGYFWFFQNTNVELVIKVLDGRGVNGAYWVFYGALSAVQYTITVKDTQTGATRTYENAFGNQASAADTSAFPQHGAAARADLGALGPPGPASRTVEPKGAPGSCFSNPATLCLNDARFRVTVDWAVPSQGTSGQGNAVSMTGDTGYFWFFQSTNVELILKVLDGRTVNGHFWVFYGALSDVQYRITVTDTSNNATRVYSNPSGNLASFADTSAF